MGTGPYMVVDYQKDRQIVMERNPNYYLSGQPYLDRLIFKIIPDPGAQTAMMAQGEAQVHLWPGETKEVYDAAVAGQAALQEIPGQWHMALRFNLSRPFDDDPGAEPPHPILGDLRVRQTGDRLVLMMSYPAVTTSGLALQRLDALEVVSFRPRTADSQPLDPRTFEAVAPVAERLEGAELLAAG